MTDNDKELLEAAAKVAGLGEHGWMGPELTYVKDDKFVTWNPLTDDGDALRLAVKLRMEVFFEQNDCVTARQWFDGNISTEEMEHAAEPYAATRRAIVRAAAALAPQVSLPLSDAKEGSEDNQQENKHG